MPRFDPTRHHGKMTALWNGAAFKQGDWYFDANGKCLGRAWNGNEWVGADEPAPAPAPAPNLAVGAAVPLGPAVMWHDDAKTLCSIDGVDFMACAAMPPLATKAELAARDPSVPHGPRPTPPRPPVAPAAPIAADDLTAIKGIGAATAVKLAAMGIDTYQGIARLSPEEISQIEETLGFAGQVDRQSWIAQAVALLAAKQPGSVVMTSTPETPTTDMTIAGLVEWAKGKERRPFGVIRKAMRDLLSVSAPDEYAACIALIEGKHMAEPDVDPKFLATVAIKV